MNVTHPNYGQNYQLTRAALRLTSFTVSELESLTKANKNTIYSFVSGIRQEDEGYLEHKELGSLRGRPQKRYTLTATGKKFLIDLSLAMATRFAEDPVESAEEAQSLGDQTLRSDMYERDEDVVVEVDVPGMTMDDLEVRIEDNSLVVIGERVAAAGLSAALGLATAYMMERIHGRIARTYPLPEMVEARITNMGIENGVLQVILPKAADQVATRAVEDQDSVGQAVFHRSVNAKESVG
jgi:HSP20 family protein